MEQVKQVVQQLQQALPDSAPYTEGGCLNFAAAVAMICRSRGMGCPTINILFREEWERGGKSAYMTTFSHCVIEELGGFAQYDAVNLEDAHEHWENRWPYDEYDEDGLTSVFRYEEVSASDLASLFAKLKLIADQWKVQFDTKEIARIATLCPTQPERRLNQASLAQ